MCLRRKSGILKNLLLIPLRHTGERQKKTYLPRKSSVLQAMVTIDTAPKSILHLKRRETRCQRPLQRINLPSYLKRRMLVTKRTIRRNHAPLQLQHRYQTDAKQKYKRKEKRSKWRGNIWILNLKRSPNATIGAPSVLKMPLHLQFYIMERLFAQPPRHKKKKFPSKESLWGKQIRNTM